MKPVKFPFISAATALDPASLDVLPTRSAPGGQCAEIRNMDPDNSGGVSTRTGYGLIQAGATHSGWSNGVNAYCVTGGQLCLFDGTATTPIYTLSTDAPLSYCQVNRLVVASNGIDYLVIDGSTVTPAQPLSASYKVAPPAGRCLAFYNGRLYISVGNTLCCTDPYSVDSCDSRQMYLPITHDAITGLAAVDDGLYIGTTKETLFLQGNDPFSDAGMALRQVNNYSVINRTMLTSNATRFRVAKDFTGAVACWASPIGFHLGGNGGATLNLSETMAMPDCETGASMIREQNGLIHYVAVLTPGAFHNTYQPPVCDIDEV